MNDSSSVTVPNSRGDLIEDSMGFDLIQTAFFKNIVEQLSSRGELQNQYELSFVDKGLVEPDDVRVFHFLKRLGLPVYFVYGIGLMHVLMNVDKLDCFFLACFLMHCSHH